VASSWRRGRGVDHPDHAGREHLRRRQRQAVRRVTVVGLASGLFNTAQQLASSIGLAVLASLAATQTEALIASGHSTRDVLASGYGRGFLGAAICVLVALALAAILLPRPPADQTSRESPGRVMRSSAYSRVPVSEPATGTRGGCADLAETRFSSFRSTILLRDGQKRR
jgi:hypothetical protein